MSIETRARSMAANAVRESTVKIGGAVYTLTFDASRWAYDVADSEGAHVVTFNTKRVTEAKRWLREYLLAENDPAPCAAAPVAAAEGFYVSVENNGRHGLLLGPYDTKTSAEGHVSEGSDLAATVDDRAHFYAYGVTRIETAPGCELPQGRLNHLVTAEVSL